MLDAWLIYRCLSCDKTWNRAIFERQSVRSIDPVVLEALQSNDPVWILKHAVDVDALKRHSQRVDTFADCEVEKKVLCYEEDWSRLEILILVPLAVGMRLDRLLATELAISRSLVKALYRDARLLVDPERKEALRRSPKSGMRVVLNLPAELDRQSIDRLMCGRFTAE